MLWFTNLMHFNHWAINVRVSSEVFLTEWFCAKQWETKAPWKLIENKCNVLDAARKNGVLKCTPFDISKN